MRASEATQEQLSPAEESLSSCARMHLWRLACASTGGGGVGAGSFGGGIWGRMGTHFAPQHCKYAEWLGGTFDIGPRGGEWQTDVQAAAG